MKTLDTDIETPWGIYRAGLPVRVVEATQTTLTIDLSPPGDNFAPRLHEIPRIGSGWPRGTKHGTRSGFNCHVRRGQQPCQKCRDAWNYAQTIRRVSTGRTGWFRVPLDAIADLYLSSSIDAQFRAERQFGKPLLDAVVRRFDNAQANA